MKRLILIGLLILTSQVFAESAAKVLFTQKNVKLNGGAVARGAGLSPGDQIVTGADSAANIQYSNGSLVNIGANTTYKILAYSQKAAVQIKAELNKGKVEIKNKGKIKETLKTPLVSLAILGTQVLVDVNSSGVTTVHVTEGSVSDGHTVFGPGSTFSVDTGGTHTNVPPPKGVDTPANSPGKIESAPDTAADAGATGTSSASTVTYENTVQTTGSTTAATTSATTAIEGLVPIALLGCG